MVRTQVLLATASAALATGDTDTVALLGINSAVRKLGQLGQISKSDLKRSTSAGRGFCQMMCDPTDCTRSIDPGNSGATECANYCQSGCAAGTSLTDCYTQLGWGVQTGALLPETMGLCQVNWADENEMCHETTNLNVLVSHYCSTQCTPALDTRPRRHNGKCVGTATLTGFHNRWHDRMCKDWCSPDEAGHVCQRLGDIQTEICGENDPVCMANCEKLDQRDDPNADYTETIWHNNSNSCPTGYVFMVGEPTKLHSYVPRHEAFDRCTNDQSGPNGENDCCGVSETSWTQGGGSAAHWYSGEMRRLGRCPVTGSFTKKDGTPWTWVSRTWQQASSTTWVSCQPLSRWATKMADVDAVFAGNDQPPYDGGRFGFGRGGVEISQ